MQTKRLKVRQGKAPVSRPPLAHGPHAHPQEGESSSVARLLFCFLFLG